MCVCVREREREREKKGGKERDRNKEHNDLFALLKICFKYICTEYKY